MLMASKGRSAEGWGHGSRLRALTRFFDSGADTHTLVPLFPYDCPLAWRFGEKKAGGGPSIRRLQPSPAQPSIYSSIPIRSRGSVAFGLVLFFPHRFLPLEGVCPLFVPPPPILLVIYPSYCPVTYE